MKILLPVVLLLLSSCGPEISLNKEKNSRALALSERSDNVIVPISDTVKKIVEGVTEGDIKTNSTAYIGILYHQDSPVHRVRVINWIEESGGIILYENREFGFIDAKLDWNGLRTLISKENQFDRSTRSMFKLELELGELSFKNRQAGESFKPAKENTVLTGPVHSAGYGTKLAKFKERVKKEFGIVPEGEGTSVAVFDGGLDLSWATVFGKRLKDYIVTDELYWRVPNLSLEEFLQAGRKTNGLKNIEDLKDLKFIILSENEFKSGTVAYDLNGSRNVDSFAIATYIVEGKSVAQFQVARGMSFGDIVYDLKEAVNRDESGIINMFTGKRLPLTGKRVTTSAAAIKFRKVGEVVEIAIVGTAESGSHGIANLHMVGGKFSDEAGVGVYNGVATETDFIYVDSFARSKGRYGQSWIFLSRGMMEAASSGVDVIDLDIYTPGTRDGNDILSTLACRIRAKTNSITIAAVHNFGALPNTIQSLSQSPCVLGIGAAHSYGADKYGFYNPVFSKDDVAQGDSFMKTSSYSGRGFGLNGTLKPDIISPAYGRTPYGKHMSAFSGTSGATPTTAGLIALLKQVANTLGKELSYSQIKYILQNSSERRVGKKIRDGYGYTNMSKALDLLLTELPTPFFIKGHKNFQYSSVKDLPSSKRIFITRSSEIGSVNSVIEMEFSVEYHGASRGKDINWLKFASFENGEPVDSLKVDLPIVGEAARLYLNFDKSQIRALPDGDHVALITGKRVGTKFQEFILPVSFTKTTPFDLKKIVTAPLYAEDGEVHYLNANVGDSFILKRGASCLGEYTGGETDLTFNGAFALSIDNRPDYIHASDVMNTYAPWLQTDSTLVVPAAKTNIAVALFRTRASNCTGGIVGTVDVKRVGFDVSVKDKANSDTITKTLSLRPTGFYVPGIDKYKNRLWKFEKDGAVDSFETSHRGTFTLERGQSWDSVSFYSEQGAELQGVVVAVKNGKIVKTYSNENRSYSSGVGFPEEIEYKIEGVDKDTTLTFISALNQSYNIRLIAPSTKEVNVLGKFRGDEAELIISSKLGFNSDYLKYLSATGKSWNYRLMVPIKIVQTTIPQISSYDLEGESLSIWKYELEFPEYDISVNN